MTPQELKDSILSLAICGKLVPQSINADSALDLMRQIREKKDELINNGVIKKEKGLPAINTSEIPFDIPSNWTWVRLGDYSQKITDQVASGSFASLRENVKSLKEPDYALMVKTADFRNNFMSNLTYTDKHGYEFLENSNLFGGELILSNIGSIGKVFIVPKMNIKMTLAPNTVMIRLVDEDYRDYLYWFLLSKQGYKELLDITSGTAMRKFNKTDLKKILIPLPPLDEQKRIVEKIEELMPLVDKYEKAWNELEKLNKQFPIDLEKSILQLAMQGKLVEQRKEEGTGEALYNCIKKAKDLLVKKGKLKKEKDFPKIEIDDIPFEIPDNWKWVIISDIFIHSAGKSLNSADREGVEMEYITTSNVYWNYFVLDNLKKMFYKENEIEKCTATKGDLLVLEGGDIGRAAIWNYEYDIRIQNHIHRLRPIGNISVEFYYYIFFLYKACGLINGVGIGLQGLSANRLKSIIVPLPPFEEQKRIVTKIEELLPLCKALNR